MEEHCKKVLTPTAMILLGATGDLAKKKLLPALYTLFTKGALPEQFYLLAFSRDSLTHDEYRAFVTQQLDAKGIVHDSDKLSVFLKKIEYTQGVFEEQAAFARIKKALEAHDARIGMCTSKLFYLAVPPTFYKTIFSQLSSVNLEEPCIIGDGWTRILVEKPFGNDLESAQKLENMLSSLFKEEQIYRIDHYLAKNALQNIIAFRFSNVLFEERWNKEFVDGVYIRVFETGEIGTRGAFFDGVGALRDVGQNHILQMLALVAMDRPQGLEAEALRDARARILRAIRIPEETDTPSFAKGQYEGYTSVENVETTSQTETYFALKAFVDTPEWEGVPFYFEHGKALSKNEVSITVRFRSSKNCVCTTNNNEGHEHPNFVTFSISPEQKIELLFWVRAQSGKHSLEQKKLVFNRHAEPKGSKAIAEAYEEVLFDALCGDQTLFVSSEEQEAAWQYITGVLGMWQSVPPHLYTPRTDGPDSALKQEINSLLHVM